VAVVRCLTCEKGTELEENEVLIVLTSKVVRISEVSTENLRALYTGSEGNLQVRPAVDKEQSSEGESASARPEPTPKTEVAVDGSAEVASLSFKPHTLSLRVGETSTLKVNATQVNDLFSLPIRLEYNPKVIRVEDVRHGMLFSQGGEEIAVVQQIDKERGLATVGVTRPPNSGGVSGDGTVLEITLRAVGVGTSELKISGVNA